jgi:hypothetical protein
VGINNGSPTVALDVTGAGKLSSSLTTAGAIFTTNDSVFSTAGTITKHATVGLTIRGTTASVFDYSLYSAAGTALMTNPTGTNNINFNSGQVWFNGGNVGIGTSSPDYRLRIETGSADVFLTKNTSSTSFNRSYFYNNNNTGAQMFSFGSSYAFGTEFGVGAGGFVIQTNTTSVFAMCTSTATPLTLGSNGTERMRITSGGDLLVGKTSTNWQVAGLQTESNGITIGVTNASSTANNLFLRKNGVVGIVASFYYDNTEVGKISITSTATTYSTNSDYRLKEDLKPINGLEKVSAIKVYDFKWKSDGTRMDGVLAHELQEIIPYAVVGEKDGEQIQAVDYSKIVPVLVKAIQELSADLTSAKQEIELLKAK